MRRIFLIVAILASLLLDPACGPERAPDHPPFGYCMVHWTQTIYIDQRIDVLFVIDNAESMTGKQAQLEGSIKYFVEELEDLFGSQYHIAVITTGMESDACPDKTGEGGRFQDRLGHIAWSGSEPIFDFTRDQSCRVVAGDNLKCLYDEAEERGTALVGVSGCPYRRGLAAMRRALGADLLGSYNTGFLRADVPLVVILISDGEDCGEPGEVSEGIPGLDERICSYAAKGAGPAGGTYYPGDPERRQYRLTPVAEYFDFLMDLKDNKQGMVRFAAIVGVKDTEDLSSTSIDYAGSEPDAAVLLACSIADCPYGNCEALPGTRAIRLAQMFGIGTFGFVDTICREDFSNTIEELAPFVSCPRIFMLSEPMLDPDLATIMFDEEPLPEYSCGIPGQIVPCDGPGDLSCPASDCVKTWTYSPPGSPPDSDAPGGMIGFAAHVDPCDFTWKQPIQRRIDLIYVTPCGI
ncbi:MAG TPA: hypothetical protein VM425_10910 [Myxococcota bacterium]|nr:hypothetical protein [Myxococcota bacterium]